MENILQWNNDVFEEIFQYKDSIRDKGYAALERIRKMHNPECHNKVLKELLERG